jgi:hypothetical protein
MLWAASLIRLSAITTQKRISKKFCYAGTNLAKTEELNI